MGVQRMDHVGIVVEDLEAAIEFFAALGLEPDGRAELDEPFVGRVIGLRDVHTEVAMLRTPDGHAKLEIIQFHRPPPEFEAPDAPANLSGLRHITFAVDDLTDTLARLAPHGAELVGEIEQYRDRFLLCYIRGPAGIIIELAEPLS